MLLEVTLWVPRRGPGARKRAQKHDRQTHQIRVVVSRSWVDEGHVWAVLDVFVITHDVNSIFARFLGPVLDITWPIILVIILNLRLGGAFNSKAWGTGWEGPLVAWWEEPTLCYHQLTPSKQVSARSLKSVSVPFPQNQAYWVFTRRGRAGFLCFFKHHLTRQVNENLKPMPTLCPIKSGSGFLSERNNQEYA